MPITGYSFNLGINSAFNTDPGYGSIVNPITLA